METPRPEQIRRAFFHVFPSLEKEKGETYRGELNFHSQVCLKLPGKFSQPGNGIFPSPVYVYAYFFIHCKVRIYNIRRILFRAQHFPNVVLKVVNLWSVILHCFHCAVSDSAHKQRSCVIHRARQDCPSGSICVRSLCRCQAFRLV